VGVRGAWIVADGVERLHVAGGGTAAAGNDLPSLAFGELRANRSDSGTPDPARGFAGRVMPLGEVQIPGDHNTSNVLAAVAVGLLFRIAPDAIRRAVADFRGVEHRLERVATIDGVTFVNDSQGTQPDAVIAALRAFEPPMVLIAGGRTKNVPLDELATVVAQRATAAILIGETAGEMQTLFARAGLARIERAPDLDRAVWRAFAIAREFDAPATVLLSPAATSFDMFVDYEQRGRAFKEAVASVAQHGGGH
jgi:UDP-N-acetylmuramoylalanine--D-glutamate ligase